jgi:hypothetical protein
MEPLSSSETSVLTRATRRNIPEDAILHTHCRENLKSYKPILLEFWRSQRETTRNLGTLRTGTSNRDFKILTRIAAHLTETFPAGNTIPTFILSRFSHRSGSNRFEYAPVQADEFSIDFLVSHKWYWNMSWDIKWLILPSSSLVTASYQLTINYCWSWYWLNRPELFRSSSRSVSKFPAWRVLKSFVRRHL